MARRKTGGPRGRPRKPTAQKRIEGNRGKRALTRNEPEPDRAVPPCPPHLEGEARAEWDRKTKALIELNLLTVVDGGALAGYCQAWAHYLEALGHLKTEPRILKTTSGYPVVNPWWAISNKALEQMRGFMNEFGLTPASRTRLHVAPPPDPNTPKDPAEAYF